MEKFCEDIGVEPENVVMLVLAWKMNARQMGFFTLQEWLKGLTDLQYVIFLQFCIFKLKMHAHHVIVVNYDCSFTAFLCSNSISAFIKNIVSSGNS